MKPTPVGACKRHRRRNKQMSCWEPDHYPLNRSSHTASKPTQEIKMVRLSIQSIEAERPSLIMLTNVRPSFRTPQLGLSNVQNDADRRSFQRVSASPSSVSKPQISAGACCDFQVTPGGTAFPSTTCSHDVWLCS